MYFDQEQEIEDKFACAAITGMLAGGSVLPYESLVSEAYRCATYMRKERRERMDLKRMHGTNRNSDYPPDRPLAEGKDEWS